MGTFPKITYIFHDGFLAECESCCLLFDYWCGQMPPIPQEKPLFVFSSHVHADHFSFSIFTLANTHPDVTFCLSNDIHRKHNARAFAKHIAERGAPADSYEKVHFLKAGEEYRIGDLTIHTIRSTDQGCAFLVDTGKELLYHAGDLNDWRWPANTEEVNRTEQTDYRREMGRLSEILHTKKGPAPAIDAAFLPLDPKQEMFYCCGFDFFMRNIGAKEAWPMHCWKQYDVIDRLLADPVSEPYRTAVRRPVHAQGF